MITHWQIALLQHSKKKNFAKVEVNNAVLMMLSNGSKAMSSGYLEKLNVKVTRFCFVGGECKLVLKTVILLRVGQLVVLKPVATVLFLRQITNSQEFMKIPP